MNIKIVSEQQELEQVFSVRTQVFVHEQNVPEEEEIDHLEDASIHFLVTDEDGKPAGAGRFRVVDAEGKIERICIMPEFRSNGVGKALMNSIEQYALSKNIKTFKLNAQNQAIPFYEKLGYTVTSDEFMDAGIPHHTMKKHV